MESAESQCLAAVSVGKQPEVADLDEAGRQDMEQKAADELDCIELHDAAAVVVPRVPPSEAHLSVIEALGYHLKTGHTLSVQNRPTGLARDVIVLPCRKVRLQGVV